MPMKLLPNFSSDSILIHQDLVSSIAWLSSEEFVSCGDDRQIYLWNIISGTNSLFYVLPNGCYPVSIQWCPIQNTSSGKQSSDMLAIGSSNGKLIFFRRSGRLEKNVVAHTGVICCVKWNCDGNSLATSGEDGLIKIWSRMGMLRSTLIHSDTPIYTFAWASCDEQIVYPREEFLIIKSLHQSSQALQWKAHDSLILEVDWGKKCHYILSGSENGLVKMWDTFGQLLLTTKIRDSPISALSWAPNDEGFAVGTFNQLNIYHQYGWLVHLERYSDLGYVNKLEWSLDGVKFVLASGSGSVILYNISNLESTWMQYYATVIQDNSIMLRNNLSNIDESIDCPEVIFNINVGWEYLVVLTEKKCYIHHLSSLYTPIIIDSDDFYNTSTIYLTEKYFLIYDLMANVHIYSYDGTLFMNSHNSSIRTFSFFPKVFSICNDFFVTRDTTDEKIVHISDFFSTKSFNEHTKDFSHSCGIIHLELCRLQHEMSQQLAFLDRNNNLFAIFFSLYSSNVFHPNMLGNFVGGFKWHTIFPILAAIQEGIFTIWFNPLFLSVDKDIFPFTKQYFPNFNLGNNSELLEFSENNCLVRNSDGSVTSVYISSNVLTLHSYISAKRWEDCTRLCRVVGTKFVWACLACSASTQSNFLVSEVAYSALRALDKVEVWTDVRKYNIPEIQNANLSMFFQKISQAESTYLQAGYIFKAIEVNLKTFNWDRAISFAIKYQTHIDTCIAFRMKFIESLSLIENKKKFKQFTDIEIDWGKILIKLNSEEELIHSKSSI